MTVYTVLEPEPTGDPAADADRVVLVREGFSWAALIVPALWLLWHRLWLVLAGWLVVVVAVESAAVAVGDPLPTIAAVALAVLFAFEANALRRWTLQRRGYRFVGVVAGAGRDECERRFFATWLIGRTLSPPAPPAGSWTTAAAEGPAGRPVIGLFPTAERPR